MIILEDLLCSRSLFETHDSSGVDKDKPFVSVCVCLTDYMCVSADIKHACPFPFVLHAATVTHPGTVTTPTSLPPSPSPLLSLHLMEVHAENRSLSEHQRL